MINEIMKLKEEKNAIILAHYYVPEEIQKIADYVGDSFYLAKVAKSSSADIIVFCGVSFMAESAKILNPGKKVLVPDMTADCPMAHMVAQGKIEEIRAQYDDLAVVCYINSTGELKCKSDVCVTSSNAVKIVKAIENKNIFFIPDKNLGSFVAQQVPEKNIILNDGCCPVHAKFSVDDVQTLRKAHPKALILTHPECEEDIVAMSDYIGSTADIITYAGASGAKEYIICTEEGVKLKLETDNPDKRFYFPGSSPCCPDMKLITIEKVLHVLKTEENQVEVEESVAKKALVPLERMLELAK